MRFHRRLGALLGALIAVSVCSTSVAKDPPEERARTEGFAVVRVVHDGGITYQRVIVEQTGGRKRDEYLLGGWPRIDNPSTYANWLPPGEYRFVTLQTFGTGAIGEFVGAIDLTALSLPPFTIEAGKMLDLGTLIQQPLGDERVAVVPWNDERSYGQGWHNERLDEAAPAFKNAVTRWDGTIGWTYKDVAAGGGPGGGLVVVAVDALQTRGTKPSLREQWRQATSPSEFVEISKRATIAMGEPQFDDAGNAFFASALGQILRRTPGGAWSNLDTGTLDTLIAVIVDGQNLYASSSEHRLFASADGGATWSTAAVPVAPNVTAIARLPNGELVAATEATDAAEVMVLRGPDLLDLPATPWKRLKWTRPPRYWTLRAFFANLDDRLLVWGDGRQLNVYEITDDRWSSSVLPAVLTDFRVNRAAGLVWGSGVSVGIAMSASLRNDGLISADGGATWRPIQPGRHAAIGFRDAMNGTALVTDLQMLKPEFFTATTADGGKTWTRVGSQVPGFCVGAAYLPPTGQLICVRNDGNIQSTRTGEEWVLEREGR